VLKSWCTTPKGRKIISHQDTVQIFDVTLSDASVMQLLTVIIDRTSVKIFKIIAGQYAVYRAEAAIRPSRCTSTDFYCRTVGASYGSFLACIAAQLVV